MVDNGHQTPEGIFLVQEEKGNGRQAVETLAVADGCVVPAEGHQYSSQLVDLKANTPSPPLSHDYIIHLYIRYIP